MGCDLGAETSSKPKKAIIRRLWRPMWRSAASHPQHPCPEYPIYGQPIYLGAERSENAGGYAGNMREPSQSAIFPGAPFSQGDTDIAQKATTTGLENGSAEQWIRWCTNHHLELTASQIRNRL